jgi:hypothetical protein
MQPNTYTMQLLDVFSVVSHVPAMPSFQTDNTSRCFIGHLVDTVAPHPIYTRHWTRGPAVVHEDQVIVYHERLNLVASTQSDCNYQIVKSWNSPHLLSVLPPAPR